MDTILLIIEIICETMRLSITYCTAEWHDIGYFILLDMFMYPVPRHDSRTVLPSAMSASFLESFLSSLSFVAASSFILKVTPNASRSNRSVFMD